MPSPGDAKSWAGSPDAGASDGAIVMTEIVFYQLQRQPLERVLPTLIEKSLERGWRVIVQAASEERVEALDAQLWIFRDDSFLPHGTWRARLRQASNRSCSRSMAITRTVRRCAF